jgi:hypothetical protein
MAIPPAAIIPGVLPAFKIYLLSPQGRYVLWALEGNRVNPEQLTRLAENGHREVFVDLEDKFKYEEYLETNLGSILANQSSPDEQKAEIFSRVSTNVVKGAFEKSLGLGTMGSEALERTQSFIENALLFITESNSLFALAKMIGHDYQTYEHATKVLWLTVSFLRQAPEVLTQIEPAYGTFDETKKRELLRQCGVGALLHDIGKVMIPQEVLNKTGTLDSVEWEIMKRHPLNGLAMLIDADLPGFIKKAVLHHHEDFHGGGYPLGLEGANITVLARILRITDVFDAMTSRRPYKEAMAPLQAVRIMIGTPPEEPREARGPDCDGAAPKQEPACDEVSRDRRDQGMRRCFDEALLKKFVVFLGNAKLSG